MSSGILRFAQNISENSIFVIFVFLAILEVNSELITGVILSGAEGHHGKCGVWSGGGGGGCEKGCVLKG